MSRQFGIYATGGDMIEIGRLVESVAEPFVIFERSRTNSVPTMLRDLASSESLSFRIARKSDFGDVRWSPLGNGREVVVDDGSPVVEVLKAFFRRQGNEPRAILPSSLVFR